MNREEFLQGLRDALSGQIPPSLVRENLDYYDDYIRTECQKGRTETDVMEELGDPRLIAQTIMDATPGSGEGAYEPYRSSGYGYSGGSRQSQEEPRREPGYQGSGHIHYYDLDKWYWKLLGIVVVILVMTVVISVVGGILSIVVPMLPALIMVALVMWFVRGPKG